MAALAHLGRPRGLRHPERDQPPPRTVRPRTVVIGLSLLLGALAFGVAAKLGFDAYRNSSLRSNVMTLSNGGQQIAAAQGLYRADHGGVGIDGDELGGLVPDYMSNVPAPPTGVAGKWELPTQDLAVVRLGPASEAWVRGTCEEAARRAGNPDAVPGRISGGTLGGMIGAFGCAEDPEGDMVFAYRLN